MTPGLRAALDAQRQAVAAETLAFTNTRGVLSIEREPSGALYFSDQSGVYKLALS